MNVHLEQVNVLSCVLTPMEVSSVDAWMVLNYYQKTKPALVSSIMPFLLEKLSITEYMFFKLDKYDFSMVINIAEYFVSCLS